MLIAAMRLDMPSIAYLLALLTFKTAIYAIVTLAAISVSLSTLLIVATTGLLGYDSAVPMPCQRC